MTMTDTDKAAAAEARAIKSAAGDKPPASSPSSPTTPPASGKGKAHRATGRPVGRPPKNKLAPKLQELIGTAGGALMVAGLARDSASMAYDGQVILSNAERLAAALEKAADENPAVRRTLEMLVQTSVWGEVAGALAAVLVPILANHGAIPRESAALMGAEVPPARPAKPAPAEAPAPSNVTDLAGRIADPAGNGKATGQPEADETGHRLP